MHQPVDDKPTPSVALDRLYDAVALANSLYVKREYAASRDILADVVRQAGRLYLRMETLSGLERRKG